MYARSPLPSQRPATTTIASRSPFPLGLCSCSTSISKMGTLAAPRGSGALKEWGQIRGPKTLLCYLRRKCVSGDIPLASLQLLRQHSFDNETSTLGRSFKFDDRSSTVIWFPTTKRGISYNPLTP